MPKPKANFGYDMNMKQASSDRNVSLLAWINFLGCFQLYTVIAIIYFAHITGSYALALSVFSIGTATSAILDIPLGLFSDSTSRKVTLSLGILAELLQIFFYATAGGFLALAIGSIFGGLSSALFSGNNDALLHDTLKDSAQEEEYTTKLGKIKSLGQIAFAGAALLGGFVAARSLNLAVAISAIPILLSLILSFFLVEPKIHENIKKRHFLITLRESAREFVRNRKLRNLSIASIIEGQLTEAAQQFQAAFYATIIPVWLIGAVKAVASIASSIGFYLSGRFVKRYAELPSIISTSLFTRVTSILAFSFPSAISPVLIIANSPAFGINLVAKNSLFQKEFSPHQRATMGSINSVAGNLFFAAIAPIFGTAADILSPARALLWLQIVLLPVVLIYLRLKPKASTH